MHEFELGSWKSLFIHLLRILDCVNPSQTNELDRRYDQLFNFSILLSTSLYSSYRLLPTFGKAIRRFSKNCSGLKKMAARNYEDILQVRTTNVPLTDIQYNHS